MFFCVFFIAYFKEKFRLKMSVASVHIFENVV